MTDRIFREIAPLVRDKMVWDAFVAALNFERDKIVNKLRSEMTTEALIRLNAEYALIERLKGARDTWLRWEQNNAE